MYEAHFGLSDLPFQISPDARFHVDTTPHRAALDKLRAGLERGDEFLLLTGDFGVGKTTVARRLLEEVDLQRYVVAELPALRLEGDDVLDRIAESFGMRHYDSHHRLGAVIRMLEDIATAGRRALLVIDEAHGLGLDSLRRLRKLTAVRTEGRGALQVCLAGRGAPAGIDELARIGRPLAIGTRVHLESLDGADTRAYVLQRLRKVGWSGRPAFGKDVTAEIHACCEGNPARINRLCGHILLQLYMQGRDDSSAGIVRAVDKMMRSEMEGEPAPFELPPIDAPPEPEYDTMLEPASRPVDEESSVDIQALMGVPIGPQLPAVRRPASALPLAPWRPDAAASAANAAQAAVRPRPWLQVAAALAIFVGGGFTWNALDERFGATPGPVPATAGAGTATASTGVPSPDAAAVAAATPAPPAIDAARLGAAAQLALTTAPPAAGHGVSAEPAGPQPAPAAHVPTTDGTPPTATAVHVAAALPATSTAIHLADPPRAGATGATGAIGERSRHRPRPRAADERGDPDPAADAAVAIVRPVAAIPAATAHAAAVAAPCSAAAETMSLCTRAAPRPSPADATRATAPTEAPAHEPPVRRACDATQAVLGLCSAQ